MKTNRAVVAVLILGMVMGIKAADAQPSDVDVPALLQRLQELEQKVKVLESKVEQGKDAPSEKPKPVSVLSIGVSGFQATSADTNFSFALRGLLQVDSRTFFADGNIEGNDAFLIRRARPIFQGTLFRDFDFFFNPDFGGSTVQIFDAYLNYRYAPWLQVRSGKFKAPVGLEYLQSDQFTLFNERA